MDIDVELLSLLSFRKALQKLFWFETGSWKILVSLGSVAFLSSATSSAVVSPKSCFLSSSPVFSTFSSTMGFRIEVSITSGSGSTGVSGTGV